MRFEGGWIKIHRSIINKEISTRPILMATWILLLGWANWKESKIIWEGKQKTLAPGDVLTSSKEIANHFEVAQSCVYKWLGYLEETGRIEITRSPRGMVITICNWETYQSDEEKNLVDNDNSEITARYQRDNSEILSEEVKKERRRRRKTIAVVSDLKSQEPFEIAPGELLEKPEALERAYLRYPRRQGDKKTAMRKLTGQIKNQDDYRRLVKAIENYGAECRGRERQHVMYFSTFVNQWESWVEIDHSPGTQEPLKLISSAEDL